tara:strand:- start:663 stop:905 length:243 start_codon:yes stop_codon:yes gene_type:complete
MNKTVKLIVTLTSISIAGIAGIVCMLTAAMISIEVIWPEPECVIEGGVWLDEYDLCHDNGRYYRDTFFGREFFDSLEAAE